jgi:hypothetical protein
MKPTDISAEERAAEARLAALFRAARHAPLPAAAERLALGFGARAEARIRAAAAETAMVSRFLWRWVTGLGVCAGIVLAAATVNMPASGAAAATGTSNFQADWAIYTAVPELWSE